MVVSHDVLVQSSTRHAPVRAFRVSLPGTHRLFRCRDAIARHVSRKFVSTGLQVCIGPWRGSQMRERFRLSCGLRELRALRDERRSGQLRPPPEVERRRRPRPETQRLDPKKSTLGLWVPKGGAHSDRASRDSRDSVNVSV